jgi:hypothetical protein
LRFFLVLIDTARAVGVSRGHIGLDRSKIDEVLRDFSKFFEIFEKWWER